MAAAHPGLTRRQLLHGVLGVGGAGLLAACGAGGGRSAGGAAATEGAAPAGDAREAIREQLGIGRDLDLSIIVPAPLLFTRTRERIVFGLGTSPAEFLPDLEVEASLVRDADREVVAGPVPATFHDEGLEGFGVYLLETEVDEPGAYWLAAAGPEHAAIGAVSFADPSSAGIPRVGEPFPAATTPTFDDPMALAELCTREPPCPMHERSVDEVLADGRPLVLTVATPQYCQTAICGPVVDVILSVRDELGRDDVDFVHVEVYSDAGNTPLPFVTETLQLPSEPWTFFVAADGTLADRLQGPTPADLVSEAASRL